MPDGFEPATTDDATAGSADAVGEGGGQATSETLDLSQYGDYQVPVKVGGEERYVPLSEAVSGYMMQSDYTQKTQQLAQEAAALEDARLIANALETDPTAAIDILMDVYGYTKAEATDAVAEATEGEGEASATDPLAQRLDSVEQRFQEMDRQAAEAEVRQDLERISSETGIPSEELLRFALDNGIPDLDIALSHYMRVKSEAAEQYQAELQAAEEKRTAEKREASFISGGANTQAGAVTEHVEKPKTLIEAGRLAMQQLGIT